MSSPEEPTTGIPEMNAIWGKGDKGDKGDRGPKGDKGDKGDKGLKGFVPESKLAEAATKEVTRLIKAKSVPKWWGRVLAGVCVVLLAFTAIGAYNVSRINSLAHANSHAAYESCIAGNKARATNEFVWDSFITLILSGDKSPNDQAHKEGAAFEKLIAANEKPQDCTKLYPGQS
jgi:hypothetical protein